MTADRSLQHLYPGFRAPIKLVLDAANAWCKVHRPGWKVIVTEGYRSVARQQELYAQGRNGDKRDVVTYKDGAKSPSNHQTCCAADFALITPKGGMEWGDEEFWKYLGHLARLNGLDWGGDWKKFKDKPHIEVPTSNKAMYAAARAWKKTVGLS